MEFIQGKKVLVTGAAGFVGSNLTRRLLSLKAQVRIFVRSESNKEIVEEFRAQGAEVVYGDIRDREVVSEAVCGSDYVFHIAALFRQAKYPDSVYYEINVQGTKNVLDAAEQFGVSRVIHCSTIGVHSHIPNPPANEEEAYRPGDVYQASKCEGEKLARERFESKRVPGVVIRPAMIWGEGDKRLLKLFKGVSRRRMPIIGSGKTLSHWVYVHDLVQGMLLAAEKEAALGRIYILAGRRPVTIRELMSEIAKQAGVKLLPVRIPARPIQLLGTVVETLCQPFGIEPPIYRRRVDFFTKDRSFDTTRARTELGFEPAQDFSVEVRNIYRWYKEQGWL